jgi:succinyldiaminopimelate transaminase
MSFVPPPYPYDRLRSLIEAASRHEGGAVECSIGTPIDEPPAFVVEALGRASGAKSYPPSIGTVQYRESMANWMARRFGVAIESEQIAACIGTKEFVASTAQYLHLRRPERDTILFPAISYPTYAMGATLAGLRPVPVVMREGALDLASINPDDAARALLLWSNSPSNPTGALDDLAAVAAWGRANDVWVASDECYAEFTWSTTPQSILQHGTSGVLAVHSISKRSNLAGLRAGFYAGDADLVQYLRSVRQHAGMMVPHPVQSAVAVAYDDDQHVTLQRERYLHRLTFMSAALATVGIEAPVPEGGFYLWGRHLGLDGWTVAQRLADIGGIVVSPGELYGDAGTPYIRLAVVQPDDALERVAQRLHRHGSYL